MLDIHDVGLMGYRAAWDLQLELHARVVEGTHKEGVLMMVEHLPVVTVGRRVDAQKHLLVSPKMLELRGVELVETDRGGDITFHGPGQLVVYPIIDLNFYGLNLHSYMRLLEEVVIRVLAEFGIEGKRLEGATGVWVEKEQSELEKVCAIGVKLRRWVTLHGLALNVSTDLSFFQLINPCGLGRPVTSMRGILGERCPAMGAVKGVMGRVFGEELRKGRRDACVT